MTRHESTIGRRVLITGGSGGIGRALAELYGEEGARLVLADQNTETLETTANELRARGFEVTAVATDVRELESVRKLIEAARSAYGGTDVLINCAGVAVYSRARDLSFEQWDRILKVNLYGTVHTITTLLPEMLERRSGQIINIASMQGLLSVPNAVPYCASKFAVVGLSRGLRAELKKEGIRVLVVNPGVVRTGIMRGAISGRVSFFGREFDVSDRHAAMFERSWLGISAEEAARSIRRAAARNKSEIELGIDAKLAAMAVRLFPGLAQRLAEVMA